MISATQDLSSGPSPSFFLKPCIQSCMQFCKTRFESAIPIYSSHAFQQITIPQNSKHKSRKRHGYADNHCFVWTYLVFFQDGYNLHKVGFPKHNVQKIQLQLFGALTGSCPTCTSSKDMYTKYHRPHTYQYQGLP